MKAHYECDVHEDLDKHGLEILVAESMDRGYQILQIVPRGRNFYTLVTVRRIKERIID